MTERDPNIVHSSLSRRVTRDGITVEVVIVRLEDASRSYTSVIATRDASGRHQREWQHEASRRRILGGSINFSVTFVAVPYPP